MQNLKFYSQHQEDFYIDHINRKHEIEVPKTVIELGAHDGIFLSNSRFFVESGWDALLVEANPLIFDSLRTNCEPFENVTVVTKPISDKGGLISFKSEKEPTLSHATKGKDVKAITYDELLKISGWEDKEIGVLSIDIEGLDTGVLNSVLKSKHLPMWIVIESNDKKERAEQMRLLLDADYYCLNIFDVNTIWIREWKQ